MDFRGVPIPFSLLSPPYLAHLSLSLQESRVRRVDQNIPEASTSPCHLHMNLVNLPTEMDSPLVLDNNLQSAFFLDSHKHTSPGDRPPAWRNRAETARPPTPSPPRATIPSPHHPFSPPAPPNPPACLHVGTFSVRVVSGESPGS